MANANYATPFLVYDIIRSCPDDEFVMTVCDEIQANETAARLCERSSASLVYRVEPREVTEDIWHHKNNTQFV